MLERLNLFHRVEDGVVVLRAKGGKYRQVPLYRRESGLYAALGGFYIRLLAHGGTSDPNTSWIEGGCPTAAWKAGPVAPVFDLNTPSYLKRLAAG